MHDWDKHYIGGPHCKQCSLIFKPGGIDREKAATIVPP
jgi:hypothetical protein